ncbi:MAG: hypothetical protein LC689_02775, partial [Myxococcales bacterium]|nr:hypothetical protein [Myxococcales bacterium]
MVLLAALACVPESKRLVIPEGMRKMNTGPSLAAAPAPIAAVQQEPLDAADPFAAADPLSETAARPPAPGTVSMTGKPPARAPAAKPPPAPSRVPQAQRYVLRLVEHGRVWEVEMPEQSGGYEVRIPLGPPVEQPTLADQELLGKETKQTPSKSYLTGLAKIAEMYSAHRYELALIELVDLEHEYPKDARIEAMKGSLYHRL